MTFGGDIDEVRGFDGAKRNLSMYSMTKTEFTHWEFKYEMFDLGTHNLVEESYKRIKTCNKTHKL